MNRVPPAAPVRPPVPFRYTPRSRRSQMALLWRAPGRRARNQIVGWGMQDFLVKLGFLLAFLPFFYGACALVQLTVIKPKTRYVVIGSFMTFAVLIGLIGLLSLAAPEIQDPRSGRLMLVVAAVTFVPMFKAARLLLSKITPIDPNSTVDISGIIVASWLIVIFGATLYAVDLTALAEQAKITVADSIITVIAYPLLALSLVGIWITRGPRESIKRLGLERVSARQIGISLGMVVPLLIAGVALDALGRWAQPQLYEQLQGILKAMSSNVTNPGVALILGASAGIGEEILFRGAIQPRLGIALTAILFALAHTQYGASYAVLGVFLIGIVLGYQRRSMNTTSAIITHGAYNVVAFLLAYYARVGTGG